MASGHDETSPSSMTSAARDLLEKATKLPYAERQALTEALWESLERESASLSPEQTAEVGNRIAQLERGEVRAIPWSEVEARLRRTLGQDADSFEIPGDFDEPLPDGFD